MAPILQHLKRIYYGTTPGALRGPAALYKEAKKQKVKGLTMAKVKGFLASQPIYTRHRPARINYPRNKVEGNVPGDVVQIDIWDLTKYKASNTHLYVLLSYDTFSKFLQGVPLANRKPESVKAALETMIGASPFAWRAIYWDKEGAFISRNMQAFLKSRNIHNYTTKSKVKAPGVERSIRTLRTLLQRRMEHAGDSKWERHLPSIISNYNRRVHSTTKLPPNDLAKDPFLYKWPGSSPLSPAKRKHKLPPLGSFVRLNRLRGLFEKEASSTWTEEVFRVIAHKTSSPIPLIYVEDLTGDKIEGGLYPEEYQQVDWNGKRDIDKVIKQRRLKNKPREYFVSYRGWPPKFNQWVSKLPK